MKHLSALPRPGDLLLASEFETDLNREGRVLFFTDSLEEKLYGTIVNNFSQNDTMPYHGGSCEQDKLSFLSEKHYNGSHKINGLFHMTNIHSNMLYPKFWTRKMTRKINFFCGYEVYDETEICRDVSLGKYNLLRTSEKNVLEIVLHTDPKEMWVKAMKMIPNNFISHSEMLGRNLHSIHLN